MFINPFRKAYSKEEIKLFKFLRKVKLFEDFTDKEMHEFIPHMYLRSYNENEAVFFRNDPSQAMYIIVSGTISLDIDVNNTFENLGYVQRYTSLGNNALLSNTYRLYNAVVSSESCELYIIPQVNIVEIFEKNKIIQTKMLTTLAAMYDMSMSHLFKSYRTHLGFFDLGSAYIHPYSQPTDL